MVGTKIPTVAKQKTLNAIVARATRGGDSSSFSIANSEKKSDVKVLLVVWLVI